MPLAVPFQNHMGQAEYEEFEYPSIPPEWTPEWMQQRIALERVDPRENPNLLLDETDQEFWNNASRKPYARKILESEQHWLRRKQVWLRQYERVEILNQVREYVLEELEECSMDVKRLVTPVLRHRICETLLWNVMREAEETGIPFQVLMDRPSTLQEFRSMRLRIDREGAPEAAAMLQEFSVRAKELSQRRYKEKAEAERFQRIVGDTDSVSKALSIAQKLRKDGYIEWHKGNFGEALTSWQGADLHLRKIKLPDEDEAGNRVIYDLHGVILKNIAQAAMKVGLWQEALVASDAALSLDGQDHKAWFRRACALEGLGRYNEAFEALESVRKFSVGRPDRGRIEKEVEARWEALQTMHKVDDLRQARSLSLALESSLFSAGRCSPSASTSLAFAEAVGEVAPGPATARALSTATAAVGHAGAEAGPEAGAQIGAQAEAKAESEALLLESIPDADIGHSNQCCDSSRKPPTVLSEGDVVIVRRPFADLAAGQRGAVLEIDDDGDARIRLESGGCWPASQLENTEEEEEEEDEEEDEEDILVLQSDFEHLMRDPAVPSASSQDGSKHRRQRLTQDGTAELLDELRRMLDSTYWEEAVAKLGQDTLWQRADFLRGLRRLVPTLLSPLLIRWGFEASPRGIVEMQLAVQDFTRGHSPDMAIRNKADLVSRQLYGDMHAILFPRPDANAVLYGVG